MSKTVEKVTITGAGLSDTERETMERDMRDLAQALIEEADERDRATMQGIAEIERGEFITIEEWAKELEALKAELAAKHGS